MTSQEDTNEETLARFLQCLENGDAAGVNAVLSTGISPNADLGAGQSPVMIAAMKGHIEIMTVLIEHGANINISDGEGRTALSCAVAIACEFPDEGEWDDEAGLYDHVFEGNLARVVRLLLESGAHVDTQDMVINGFLMLCCDEGRPDLVGLLLENGGDVNARGEFGFTPLIHAVSHPDTCELLLEHGADIHLLAPLTHAVSHPDTCKLLLEHGADIHLRDNSERTALDIALSSAELETAKLLLDYGSDINEEDYYLTRAAEWGNTEVVEFLLENGVDPNRKNGKGDSALKLGRQNGHRDVVVLLREALELPKLDRTLPRDPVEGEKEEDHGLSPRSVAPLGPPRKKNFFREDKEIFGRCWWLAIKVWDAAGAIFSPTAASSWFNDDRYYEQDQKLFYEVLGYTMSAVLDRILEEIKVSHGWDDEAFDLNAGYWVMLGTALDQVAGFKNEEEKMFVDLLREYYSPDYGDDYYDYWAIGLETNDGFTDKALAEFFGEPVAEDELSVERVHAYRLSKLVKVEDPQKVVRLVRSRYRDIGLAFYDDAFFGLSLDRIREELKGMTSQ